MSMLCSQCGAPAERCARCAGALCARRLCAELHEAACSAVSVLPSEPVLAVARAYADRRSPPRRRERNPDIERLLAAQLVENISDHRRGGRAALLVGDLDTAFDELCAARLLETDIDRLGPDARACLPREWELETDLTPLARALSAGRHPRASDAWYQLLADRPARSIQAEAAEWLARAAFEAGHSREGLRMLHAASRLGRPTPPGTFAAAYRQANLDPVAAFGLYLAATRVDAGTARSIRLRDPLTEAVWADQDPRWWWRSPLAASACVGEPTEHGQEALGRARDLASSRRDVGWLHLAEGDGIAGPIGVRDLGRSVRTGRAEAADEDAFLRIRLAYEGAADRLPDVAWPWYRLAELLAWAGFEERAREHLAHGDQRTLGSREADSTTRRVLRGLVRAGLGEHPDGMPPVPRPFPSEPFGPRAAWRLRLW
ncbi:MAG: hypothetical protein JO157_08330 [Acetobacteraceae bacterium]|nr:hypothetical protein [Acetobacteraceae bacterium]